MSPKEKSVSLPYYQGTGRRKTSIARVRLVPGEGQIVINGRTYVEHFGGAIISVESRFKSGLSFNTKYHYKPQLSSEKKILFDKYQSIYLSNLDLLKKYKTNSKSK